ncbi:Daunorubicin/doxorubicin resistance ATP-binding protein DrrA [Planctomycetes bacterium Pla163]|uniref:Daunorubicin/doxorubicin resistance ATP-binding protein DrrA n=1 Tax=Rohdeia mirabilis TaxID=2528008 RepID=A0A518CZN6_9BACT|nr:Daunorubicin/doxorubicin resistance ATP-binding protein DrrA [Planctomycetes bacterium Pla163]
MSSTSTLAPTSRSNAIVVRGLTKRFGQTVALAPLDLDLARGSVCGLVGPNGSGKSTFMRLLVGLVPASAGSVEVDGARLTGEGLGIRRRVAFAPGEIAAYGDLTADRQLAFLLRGRDAGALDRARALAKRLGLPLRGRMRTFSHGMKRQVMFCAAMAPDVPVRLLDEPTAGLDPTKRGEVVELVAKDARAGRCVLLSSHHFGEVARCCERVVFLAGGRLVADERTADLELRARRLLTLEFERDVSSEQLERLAAALHGDAGANVRIGAARLAAELGGDDVLAALRGLPADGPVPTRITFGSHSLEELYRDLYGVEGL